MNLVEFRKEVIEKGVFPFDSPKRQRIESAYCDFLNIANVATEKESQIAKADIFELAEKGDEKRVKEVTQEQRNIVTLLKATYLFADIYISVLLSEIIGQPGISLNDFLKKPQEPLLSLSVDEILPAYCAVIYRNKIIAHHDVQRQYTYVFATEFKDSRLLPYSEFFHVTKKDIPRIMELKEIYKPSIPELFSEQNQFKLVWILFYNIPIGRLGAIGQDRQQINRIAENGGCRSASRQELVEAIDKFSLAVMKAAS